MSIAVQEDTRSFILRRQKMVLEAPNDEAAAAMLPEISNSVVPIITASIAARSTALVSRMRVTALTTPVPTSAVVKLFAVATTSRPGSSAASVFVPPTPMPSLTRRPRAPS